MSELHPNVYGHRETACAGTTERTMVVVVHKDVSGIPIAVEAMGVMFERKPT